MHQLPVFFGALSYEFRIQVRRRAVWITMILLALMIVGILSRGRIIDILTNRNTFPLLTVIVYWTNIVNTILPIGVGVLLADRLPRDRRTRVDELFITMPGALSVRLLGKYLGSTMATLLPMFAFYSLGIGYVLYQTQSIIVLPLALETFAAIVLPGILFISAFSIACPSIIWVPLYQFLFVGYWFWGNLFPARIGIPTLSDTILTPIGGYISLGFFGSGLFQVSHASALQGMESLLLLLGIAILVIVFLWSFLKWQQARQ